MMCGVWKAMLPVSISEHHCPSSCMDNLSLVDTVIKIPICWFHHKLHLLVFTTAVLVSIIRSSASSSSIVKLYARHGANNGMAAWTRHHKVVSIDSVIRNFSGMHLGCPGLGDKMFNNATADHRPLTSISQHHHQKV